MNSPAKATSVILPQGALAAKILKTRFFLLPGGYVAPRVAKPFGGHVDGPMPCNTLAKTNDTNFCSAYTLRPAARDYNANQQSPTINMHLYP